jgi:hypothetical protein
MRRCFGGAAVLCAANRFESLEALKAGQSLDPQALISRFWNALPTGGAKVLTPELEHKILDTTLKTLRRLVMLWD